MIIRINSFKNCKKISTIPSVSGVVLTRLLPAYYKDSKGQKLAVEELAACCHNLANWSGRKFLCINYSPAFNRHKKRWAFPQDLLTEFQNLADKIREHLPLLDLAGVCLVGEFLRKSDPSFDAESLAALFSVAYKTFDCQLCFTEYNAKKIERDILKIARRLSEASPLAFVGQLYSDKPSDRKYAESKFLASCGLPLAYVEAAGFCPFNNPFAESYAALMQQQIQSAARAHNLQDLCWWNAFPDEIWVPRQYQERGGKGIAILNEEGTFNSFGKKLI